MWLKPLPVHVQVQVHTLRLALLLQEVPGRAHGDPLPQVPGLIPGFSLAAKLSFFRHWARSQLQR